MTKNIESRKYKIIQEVIKMDDEFSVSTIEQKIAEIQEKSTIWKKIIIPTRKTISISEMIEEQEYIPIEEQDFFQLAEEIQIEESIEELLSQID